MQDAVESLDSDNSEHDEEEAQEEKSVGELWERFQNDADEPSHAWDSFEGTEGP